MITLEIIIAGMVVASAGGAIVLWILGGIAAVANAVYMTQAELRRQR